MGLPAAPYALGEGTHTEQERLIAQASSLEPHARWMLDHIAIKSGSKAVDFGCGPIGIMNLLSERVGSDGVVIGIEREPRFAAMARAELNARDLRNVQLVVGNALNTGLEKNSYDMVQCCFAFKALEDNALARRLYDICEQALGSFDCIGIFTRYSSVLNGTLIEAWYERLVLINLPTAFQQELLAEMVSLLKPGGTIALQFLSRILSAIIDFGSWERAYHHCKGKSSRYSPTRAMANGRVLSRYSTPLGLSQRRQTAT
jgi:SAM-dependent methyltransferase